MAKITKSVTFDDERDAALLAWLNGKPNFSRFVRRALYRAKEGPGASSLTPDDIRIALRAELSTYFRSNRSGMVPESVRVADEVEDTELEQNLDNLFG